MSVPLPVRAAVATVAAVALTGAALLHAALPHAAAADPNARLYAIGDSWAAGLYADPAHALIQDAADHLGMTAVVDGESGSGYLTAPGGTRTYADRAERIPPRTTVDLVVVQGGSNDDAADLRALPAAVDRTVRAVRAAMPRAAVVLLGPGPDPWPLTGVQWDVDRIIGAEAARLHVRFVSPLEEGWFTEGDVDDIIDPVTHHPTVHGDEILGARLAADLRPHPARGRPVSWLAAATERRTAARRR